MTQTGGRAADIPQDDFAKNVRRYRYSSPNLSLFERLFLNSFWEFVASCYPPWLAPNLISLSGLLCVLVAACISLYYSPRLEGTVPSWGYVILATLFFAYQTLDGSDGKQARRTGSGSPLGELVDHGIDAFTTPIIAWFTLDVFAYGYESPMVWMPILIGPAGFAFSNLTLLHKGTQYFGDLDIMELQTVMIGALITTAVLGPEMWQMEVFGWVVRDALMIGGGGMVCLSILQWARIVLQVYALPQEQRPESVQRGWSGTGLASALFQFCLVASLQASWWAVVLLGKERGREEHWERLTFLWVVATSHADMMDRILVTRVSGERLVPIGPMLAVLFSGVYVTVPNPSSLRGPLLVVIAVVSQFVHGSYFFSRAARIARACNIHPLRVSKPIRE